MTGCFTLNDYCKKEFGHKLYKLSLSGVTTCPNRDGSLSFGGCVFCSEKGSGEFCEKGGILKQIELAKLRVKAKNSSGKYIAYFQSFTNTYAPVSYLEEIFTQAVLSPDIEVLSIATRPDCLEDEKIELLKKLNKIKPVWIELGLQSTKESSIKYIRRSYENEKYVSAVKKLNKAGIKVVTHIILGLPGETKEDMLESINFAVKNETWGLKLHMLYISSDAPIYSYFLSGKVKTFKKEEYISLLEYLIPRIPDSIVLHRITGDGDKKTLVSPLWSGNKKDVLNSINNAFKEKNIIQGAFLT